MKAKKFLFSNVIILMMVLSLAGSLGAQVQRHGQRLRQQMKKENIESLKVAFITKKLNLTTDEAKAFWPVYDEFEAKKKEINQWSEVKYKKIITDSLTENQASEMIDQQIIHAQKILDLRKEYLIKFRQVLSAKKIAKLYDAEKKFRRILLKEVRDRRKEQKIEN